VAVVPGVFQIVGLNGTTTTLSADDPFYVQSGYVATNGSTFHYASVSGAGPLPVTFTSSEAAVGLMAKTGETAAAVTIEMPVNTYNSPTTMAAGGVAFDAQAAGGTTRISARPPGSIPPGPAPFSM